MAGNGLDQNSFYEHGHFLLKKKRKNYVDLSIYHPQPTFMTALKIFLPSPISPPSFLYHLRIFYFIIFLIIHLLSS